MRIKISGSRAHRVWKCPASAVLPQVESSEQNPAQGKGKAIHRFLERAKATEPAQALAEAPEDLRPMLECLNLDELPAHVATEVTLAWDWKTRTGREIGRNLDRQYTIPNFLESIGIAPPGETEHLVTVDVLGQEERRGAKLGLVGDYKTGRTRYPSPDKFGQTLLGAVAARSVFGFDEVIVDLYYIDDDGENYTARRRLDEWDLDAFEMQWAAAMRLVDDHEDAIDKFGPDYRPNVIEGPHCDYCPAYKSCPAKLALVSRLPVAVDDMKTTTMTRTRAASAWLVLEQMKTLIGEMQSEIIGMACSEPIDLPDGRVIGPVVTERRGLDPNVAIPILRAKYGDEAVSRAVKQTLSLDALRDEVSARRAKGEKISTKHNDGVYDLLLKDIERNKGLELKRTESVRAHVPKKAH